MLCKGNVLCSLRGPQKAPCGMDSRWLVCLCRGMVERVLSSAIRRPACMRDGQACTQRWAKGLTCTVCTEVPGFEGFNEKQKGKKHEAAVESQSWGSAYHCFQAGNVHLANPTNQTPAKPSCLANPSVGEPWSPPWASLCLVPTCLGKHSLLSGACNLQTVSLLFFTSPKQKPHTTQKPHNLSCLQSKVFLRPDRIQLNSPWG